MFFVGRWGMRSAGGGEGTRKSSVRVGCHAHHGGGNIPEEGFFSTLLIVALHGDTVAGLVIGGEIRQRSDLVEESIAGLERHDLLLYDPIQDLLSFFDRIDGQLIVETGCRGLVPARVDETAMGRSPELFVIAGAGFEHKPGLISHGILHYVNVYSNSTLF